MATTKPTELVAQYKDVVPEPILEVCGNCRHWAQSNMLQSFGQCMLSGKGFQAPLITTDRASCGSWVDRG